MRLYLKIAHFLPHLSLAVGGSTVGVIRGHLWKRASEKKEASVVSKIMGELIN